MGFHRLWSHSSFKATKTLEFILVMLTAGTLQGPVIAWASDHRKHHSFTDKEGDPHSPYFGMSNKLVGFFWSHIGWMIFSKNKVKNLDRLTVVKCAKNKLLKWQFTHYWSIAIFMNLLPPALIGLLFFHNIQGIVAGIVFMGLGRAIQHQATFCINSVTHFFGSKAYTNETAGDIWWMAPFLLGENYHNFHHAFSQDYRNGHKWYHLDAHKWIIYLLSKVGLAYDLVVTHNKIIESKKNEVSRGVMISFMDRLKFIESAASKLACTLRERINELEKSATNVVEAFRKKLVHLENSALYIESYAKKLATETDLLTERGIINILTQFKSVEKVAYDLLSTNAFSNNKNERQL